MCRGRRPTTLTSRIVPVAKRRRKPVVLRTISRHQPRLRSTSRPPRSVSRRLLVEANRGPITALETWRGRPCPVRLPAIPTTRLQPTRRRPLMEPTVRTEQARMGATVWPTRAATATLAVADTQPAAAEATLPHGLLMAGVEATAPGRPMRAVATPHPMSPTAEAEAATTLVVAAGDIPPGVAADTAEVVAADRG